MDRIRSLQRMPLKDSSDVWQQALLQSYPVEALPVREEPRFDLVSLGHSQRSFPDHGSERCERLRVREKRRRYGACFTSGLDCLLRAFVHDVRSNQRARIEVDDHRRISRTRPEIDAPVAARIGRCRPGAFSGRSTRPRSDSSRSTSSSEGFPGEIATKRTTGVPRSVRTTSSPCRASSTKWLSFAFASRIPTLLCTRPHSKACGHIVQRSSFSFTR